MIPLLGLVIPWWGRALAIGALALALYTTGRVQQRESDQAEQLVDQARAEQAEMQRRDRLDRAAHAAAVARESESAHIETVYRTITREVPHVIDRPIYRDCSLDADGVRLYNAAQAGDPQPSPPAQPADPVRPPAAPP